jgi:hypothetical protein
LWERSIASRHETPRLRNTGPHDIALWFVIRGKSPTGRRAIGVAGPRGQSGGWLVRLQLIGDLRPGRAGAFDEAIPETAKAWIAVVSPTPAAKRVSRATAIIPTLRLMPCDGTA